MILALSVLGPTAKPPYQKRKEGKKSLKKSSLLLRQAKVLLVKNPQSKSKIF